MKFWILQTDQRSLETGRNDETNWMVRELGLTKILFEPPPPRPKRRITSDALCQPELLTLVLTMTLGLLAKAPSSNQVREGAKSLLIAALAAVTDVLDEATRRGG